VAETREEALERLVDCLDGVIALAVLGEPAPDDLLNRIHILRSQIKH